MIVRPNSGVISFGGLNGSSDFTESGFDVGLFEGSEVKNSTKKRKEMKLRTGTH